jgi:hypothetical protein
VSYESARSLSCPPASLPETCHSNL